MATQFEKWWENKGLLAARKKGLLEGTPDAVEIARLAFETGLYESPPEFVALGKARNFPTHFVKCDCGGHQLECEVFNYKDGEAGVNFTVWEYGRDGKKIRSWKEKFRWCWNIIKTGMPWADDIIVTNKEARGLASFILQNVPTEQSNEENKK